MQQVQQARRFAKILGGVARLPVIVQVVPLQLLTSATLGVVLACCQLTNTSSDLAGPLQAVASASSPAQARNHYGQHAQCRKWLRLACPHQEIGTSGCKHQLQDACPTIQHMSACERNAKAMYLTSLVHLLACRWQCSGTERSHVQICCHCCDLCAYLGGMQPHRLMVSTTCSSLPTMQGANSPWQETHHKSVYVELHAEFL